MAMATTIKWLRSLPKTQNEEFVVAKKFLSSHDKKTKNTEEVIRANCMFNFYFILNFK